MMQFHFVIDSFSVHTIAQHRNVNEKVKASNTFHDAPECILLAL